MAEMHQRGLWVKFFLLLAILSAPLTTGSSVAWAQSIFVTNTADSGPGSLRAAIVAANADPDANPIIFDTSALSCPITTFVGSTTLGSQLPALTGVGDTIDGSACGVTLDGSALMGANDDGLRVRASNITVRGLTIQSFPRDGVRVEPPPNLSNRTVTGVVISHNVIQGNGQDGLRVSGQTGTTDTGGNHVSATIANNRVLRNGDDGIVVFGGIDSTGGHTVEAVISNNLIRGSGGVRTGGTITGDGIRVLGSATGAAGASGGNNTVVAAISHNRVEDNVDDGIVAAGAGASPGSNNSVFVQITDNFVKKSGAAVSTRGIGIGVRGGSQETAASFGTNNSVTFLFAGNKIEESKDFGISVSGGQGDSHKVRGTISGNKVGRSGADGIRVTGGGGIGNMLMDINILENEVGRSGQDGIRITGGGAGSSGNLLSNITVKGNESQLNGRHGIGVVLGAGVGHMISVTGITDNTTNSNGQDGIFVASGIPGSGATPISANHANKNGQDGIDLNSTGYVVLANKAKNNAGAGIDAAGNIDGGGNIATGNATCNTPGCF